MDIDKIMIYNQMKKIGLLLVVFMTSSSIMFGQGANNIKINEVMVNNTDNYLDEYGRKLPWVELVNNSFTTYNVRGMFITTNKEVLDKDMSVPERMKLMGQIPNGFKESLIEGRQHLLLYLNSKPEKGPRHLDVVVDPAQTIWIALYDGNGKNLIDSVTIPVMKPNCSFARIKDGAPVWKIQPVTMVTPNSANNAGQEVSKIENIKANDPYGILMAIIAMSIVFLALVLLYIFMKGFGKLNMSMEARKERTEKYKTLIKIRKASKKAITMAKDGYQKKGINKETYMAVIAMALSEYAQDVHDLESGIITIKRKNTAWNAKQF